MINKIVNSILTRASQQLSESKDKILVLSKKKSQETFNKIPSPESFKNELDSLSSNSPDTLQKAERIYQKTTQIINKTIQKLERTNEEFKAIKQKLIGISDRFTFLDDLLTSTPLKELIELLNTLPSVIDGILATQVTPVVSGTVINKSGDFKKMAKDNAQKFRDITDSLPIFQNFFDKEINKLIPPINTGISNIQSIIDQLKALLEQIQTIWANFILGLNLPELQDTTTDDNDGNSPLSGTTLEEYLSNPNNLDTAITDLIYPGTRKLNVEVRENGPGTELYKSNIIETTID